MNQEHARRLIDRIDVLRHPCDLDLLVFFARHRRTLLASEQLAAFLGYGVKEIAESLDRLLEAGLITRTTNPAYVARFYVFSAGGSGGGWLPEVLRAASTREGRLAMVWALRKRTFDGTGGPVSRVEREAADDSGPRLFRRKAAR